MLRGAVGLTASETHVHVGFLRDASVATCIVTATNVHARSQQRGLN